MAKKNGRTKMIIAIVGLTIVVLGVVMSVAKSYFILPIEQAHQKEIFTEMKKENNREHDEFVAVDKILNNDRIELKTDVKHIIATQERFMQEQKTTNEKILDGIRELHK